MNSQVNECPICFDTIGDKNNITTECGHKFHASCLMTNVNSNGFNCPCCRSLMVTPDVEDDSDSDSDSDSEGSYTITSETISSDSEDYNLQDNEYVLRGFRFFMNQQENIQHDEEDEADEDDDEEYEADREMQISILPTVENITGKIIEKGISMNQLVGAMMSITAEFEIHSDMADSYRDIWKTINNVIATEMDKNMEAAEPLSLVVSQSMEEAPSNLAAIQSNKTNR